MTIMKAIPYRTHDHGNFETEWGVHHKVSEWWYATGYFTNDAQQMYSYQFTLIRTSFFFITANVLMLALTDFSSGQHYYSQKTTLFPQEITIDEHGVRYGDSASILKGENGMRFHGIQKNFSLDLEMDYGKGASWHCDRGVLRMGIDAPGETTLYYSYTNMPTRGKMTLGGKTFAVTGKSWFDKQGGPFSIMNRLTHWEWFSLRFFDNEEMMLFTFPQSNYQDGTYIPRTGGAQRLTDYQIRALDFVEVNNVKFSTGWTLDVPGLKAEHYTIRPIMPGQMNLAYFEQLAGIYTAEGTQTGLCFVELLPGVYNSINPLKMFKKVE